LSPPEIEPVEQAVERMGQQFGSFTARASRSAWSLGAHLGEEARDIWTEAQAIRHEKGASPRP
jgi:hypothetical protein